MSRLDDLIAELCPQGVPHSPLRDVTRIAGGNVQPSAMGLGLVTVFSLPSYDRHQIPETLAGSLVGSAKIKLTEPCILVAKLNPHIPRVWRLQGLPKDAYCSPEFYPVTPRNGALLLGYLYHFMLSKMPSLATGVTGSTNSHKRLQREDFLALRIPVPPLEVQREIVKILDTFTKLEAELEAELEARRRQYGHYRSEALAGAGGWPIRLLGDLAENLDSMRRPVTKSARVPGAFPYYGASGVVDHVSGFIFDGDYLLVSEDGANLLARSTPIAFAISGKTWVNNHAHVLKFETYEERRFVDIYLNSIDLSPFVTGAAQPKLNQANLNSIPIPDPPFEEKKRIVATLDAFDALVNDLSVGLPAELAARRKQYDYYRDKVLTFPEAG